MLAIGAIALAILGIHYSLAYHGCPESPTDCWTYCNKTKECLTGYCEIFDTSECICAGCNKNPKLKYRNYGCVAEERDGGSTVPTEAPKTKEATLRNKLKKLMNRPVLKPNIWLKIGPGPEVLRPRQSKHRHGIRKALSRKRVMHH